MQARTAEGSGHFRLVLGRKLGGETVPTHIPIGVLASPLRVGGP